MIAECAAYSEKEAPVEPLMQQYATRYQEQMQGKWADAPDKATAGTKKTPLPKSQAHARG